MIDVNDIVARLNSMLEADPKTITALFACKVTGCNAALVDHPTAQVRAQHDDTFSIGVLGLLNGAVSSGSPGAIYAVYEGSELLRFEVNPHGKA